MRAEAIVGIVVVLVTLSIGSILWLSAGSDDPTSLDMTKSNFDMKEAGPAGLASDTNGLPGGFGLAGERDQPDNAAGTRGAKPTPTPTGGPEAGRRADLIIPEVQPPARRVDPTRPVERETRTVPQHRPGSEPSVTESPSTRTERDADDERPAAPRRDRNEQPPAQPMTAVNGEPAPSPAARTPNAASPTSPSEGSPPVTPPARTAPPPAPKRYQIQENDTLIAIAREHYGDEKLWPAFKLANPGLHESRLIPGRSIVVPSIEDAQRLLRGESVARPAETVQPETKPAETTTPAVARATYVVGRGDSLSSIARNVLGSEGRWREIYELNRDKLKSPDVVPLGTELRLPADVSATTGGGSRG